MEGINYVSDFSKVFTVHYSYSIDKTTIGSIIMGHTITMAREISAMILYDRSMARDQKADKERYRVENPEFIKPDVSEIRRYAEYEDLKKIPYNIESFLFAATNALNLVYSLVDRVTTSNNKGSPTVTEREFYWAMANIQTEIENRIGIDLNIEIVKVEKRDPYTSKFLVNEALANAIKSRLHIKDELKKSCEPQNERDEDISEDISMEDKDLSDE